MRFLIYGAGALGQTLGCLLASQGHSVSLVIRERFIQPIRDKGLSVTGIFGNFHAAGTDIELLTTLEPRRHCRYDYILITTKSYGTSQAVSEISTLESCSCPVVSMQNGCGNLEQLIHQFGRDRSLGARVITGFEIQQAAAVKITVSADDIHIGGALPGAISPAAHALAAAINKAGLPAVPVEDINQSLFAKLLYNCALNPLGAILGVPYGDLAEKTETRNIMNNIIEETFAVIVAMGTKMPWKSPDEYKELFYSKLIPATANHRASMLQDLENGKPTEVEALVGYVSKAGRRVRVTTTTCDILASMVRFKESQNAN